MPIVFKLRDVLVCSVGILVLSDNGLDLVLRLGSAENVGQLLGFAGRKNDIALKRAAGVRVVVKLIF